MVTYLSPTLESALEKYADFETYMVGYVERLLNGLIHRTRKEVLYTKIAEGFWVNLVWNPFVQTSKDRLKSSPAYNFSREQRIQWSKKYKQYNTRENLFLTWAYWLKQNLKFFVPLMLLKRIPSSDKDTIELLAAELLNYYRVGLKSCVCLNDKPGIRETNLGIIHTKRLRELAEVIADMRDYRAVCLAIRKEYMCGH